MKKSIKNNKVDFPRIQKIKKKIDKIIKPIDFLIKIIAIVIVLAVILEVCSYILITIYINIFQRGVTDSRINNEIFKDKEWAGEYFKEYKMQEAEYYPYVGHKVKPFSGECINVDKENLRRTSNPCSGEENRTKIFFFGGSTAWGSSCER